MPTHKHRFLNLLLVFGLFAGCSSDDDPIAFSNEDYLIFGHFYGMCVGERCVETYKLTSTELYADQLDDYSGQSFEFQELSKDEFEQTKDLLDDFPRALLEEEDNFIGCPDCADGGGLFIQYVRKGKVKSWRIDQNKNNIPEYLHDFVDKVNAKIAALIE